MLSDRVLQDLRKEGRSSVWIARAYGLSEWKVYARMKELGLFKVQLDKSGHKLQAGTVVPGKKPGRFAHLK